MDVVAALRARLHASLEAAKELVAMHYEILHEAKLTTDKERLASLCRQMDSVHKKWQDELRRCNALRQILADYHNTGWESRVEIKLR